MYFFQRASSLFLPLVTRIPMKDLIQAPRWNAWMIMLALMGDVIVASSVPLGVLVVLSAAGALSPWAAVAIADIFFATITILKLGEIFRVYPGHFTTLIGGPLYIFKDGHGELATMSTIGQQWISQGPAFYVELTGLAFWIEPTMLELPRSNGSSTTPFRLNVITARTHPLPV